MRSRLELVWIHAVLPVLPMNRRTTATRSRLYERLEKSPEKPVTFVTTSTGIRRDLHECFMLGWPPKGVEVESPVLPHTASTASSSPVRQSLRLN